MTQMTNIYQRLYLQTPDTQFDSFDDMYTATFREEQASQTRWIPPANLYATVHQCRLMFKITGDRGYELNDWSFAQLCTYLNADRGVIERLTVETAAQVLSEIFPHGDRPLHIYTVGSTIRSIHPISYERLPNSSVLEVVVDEATHLTEYRDQSIKLPAFFMGERDMFAYLIDESAWLVYREERFAPAFVIWNSEVGARSVGIRSGWYHAGTKGFMLEDTSDPMGYSRRHSFGVHEALSVMRGRIHLWHATTESRCERFLDQLSQAKSQPFAESHDAMKTKLQRQGVCKPLTKAIEKCLTQSSRTLSCFEVALAILSAAQAVPFAATRFELGQVGGSLIIDRTRTNVPTNC